MGEAAGREDLRLERLVVLLAASLVLAVRLVTLASLQASPLSDWHLWRETDEHAYLEWSARLAAGSWLDQPAFRPYFAWQAGGGGPEAWEARLARDAYFTGPLYAYALAGLRRLAGDPVLPARLLQALLAAVASAAVGLAAARSASRLGVPGPAALAGGAAALLHGTYAPLVFHDGFAYRDGPVAHVSAILAALPLLLGAPAGPVALVSCGLLAGLGAALKQTLLPLGLVALGALVVRRPGRGDRARAAAWALAGLCAGLGPFVARNVAVGVPPLTFDTRQAIGLAWGNAPGADGTVRPPASMVPILDEAKGSTVKTALLVLAAYEGRWGDLLELQLRKAASFFGRLEVADNASFDHFRGHLRPLRLLPVFACLLGPGLVGLAAARKRRLLDGWETAAALTALLVPFVSSLLVQTTSRYRAGVAGPLALGAGLGLAVAAAAWREPSRRRVAALGAGAAVLLSLVPLLPPAIPASPVRVVDTLVCATLAEARGDLDGARDEVVRYLREGAEDPDRAASLLRVWLWWSGTRRPAIDPPGLAPPEARFRPLGPPPRPAR